MRMLNGEIDSRSGTLVMVDCWSLGSYAPFHRSMLEMPLNHGGIGSLGTDDLQLCGVYAPKGKIKIEGMRTVDGNGWRYIDVVLKPHTVVAKVEPGYEIIVNHSRILIADADLLDVWKHNESIDGLADVAFWGRDQDKAAAALGAPKIGSDTFGWENLPLAEAEPKYAALVDMIDNQGFKLMADFRPHSHHFQLLAAMRTNPYSLGMITLDGMTGFGLFTPGDGAYPVLSLLDDKGNRIGVRIDIARDGMPDITGPGAMLGGIGEMPPDPMTATQNALSNAAGDMITSHARKAVIGTIKGYLPKFLHPLLPGEKGTVGEKLKKMATDYMWEMVISAVITLFFIAAFAIAIGGVLLIVLYAVLSTLWGM